MLNVTVQILKNLTSYIFHFIFSIKLLMFIKFLTGFYYNFSDKLITKRFGFLFCLSANTLLTILALMGEIKSLMFYFALFERFLLIFISIYTEEEYFRDYLVEIQRIGRCTGFNHMELETFLTRILNCIVYLRLSYLFMKKNALRSLPLGILLFCSQDFGYVPVIIMLELFRYRIKILRAFAERNLQNLHVEQGSIRVKLCKIKKVVHVYKNLYNNLEANFSALKFLIAVKFVTNFRQIMYVAYLALTSIISQDYMFFDTGLFVEAIMTSVISFMAPVLVELAANDIDKIETVLADKLLFCTENDIEVRDALQDALAYLRARPFRCVLWRAFAVDAYAPLAFLALVTNYLTVMIQFMKPPIDM